VPRLPASQVARQWSPAQRADVFEITPAAKVTFRGGTQRRRLIGVYGGSFDPPTMGHMSCVKHLANGYRHTHEVGEGDDKRKVVRPLDEVWVVPNHLHWKESKRKGRASYDDRIEMLELSIAKLEDGPKLPMLKQPKPKIRISKADQEAGGVSHPVKRIRHIAASNPDAHLVIFFGGDMKAEVEKWEHYDELKELADVVFLARPGYSAKGMVSLPASLTVSSTEVRRAVAAGDFEALRGKVDPDVLELLKSNSDIRAKYHARHAHELEEPNAA